MRYVRVRDTDTGHEFSTPEGDPLITAGLLKLVDRKAATTVPLPPKHHLDIGASSAKKKES